ncbi:copper homeostasis protein CutC, partial [candidate division KSB1 bacterium]|nr:copper homeostasis protein CutC [candidate division KSB1 bacterium]
MIKIEVCVQCDSLPDMITSIRAAGAGGAATIELCRDMSVDGLTPERELILAARKNFTLPGLMVMIRPRAGDFCYSASEIAEMGRQIDLAAECGADGVVYGLLQKEGELALKPLRRLLQRSKKHHLAVTFHRAFDALRQPASALATLIDLGVDRILTSGTKWGSGLNALAGLASIGELVERAGDRIDIVAGGGVTPANAAHIVASLTPKRGYFSLHAYSGVQKDG